MFEVGLNYNNHLFLITYTKVFTILIHYLPVFPGVFYLLINRNSNKKTCLLIGKNTYAEYFSCNHYLKFITTIQLIKHENTERMKESIKNKPCKS